MDTYRELEVWDGGNGAVLECERCHPCWRRDRANRSEASLDAVEESLLDTNEGDADIGKIAADGRFVTYELTIHGE